MTFSACLLVPKQMKSAWERKARGLYDGAQGFVNIVLIFTPVTATAKYKGFV